MTPTMMIYSPELNMMLVPIKITCTECKGEKKVNNPKMYITLIKQKKIFYPELAAETCPTCKGEGFYTVNHL